MTYLPWIMLPCVGLMPNATGTVLATYPVTMIRTPVNPPAPKPKAQPRQRRQGAKFVYKLGKLVKPGAN